MISKTWRQGFVAAAFTVATVIAPVFISAQAWADETPETFMSKANLNKDKTLTLAEVTTYALKRFAAIDADHDGTLTEAELGGRISNEDFAVADTKHGAGSRTLSKSEFTTYIAKLFVAANSNVKPGDTKADGTLSVEELGTPAGLKLIKLLD